MDLDRLTSRDRLALSIALIVTGYDVAGAVGEQPRVCPYDLRAER